MLNRTIAKYLFYFVAIVTLLWTGSLTYSFLTTALPGAFWAVPLLALIVFDVGMVSWLFVFLSHAEGAIQRATAIILCLFDFIGVGLMVVAEILLGGQQYTAAPEMVGTLAIWGIAIWTVVNVLGIILFHLGDNNARREMAMQSEKDAVFDAALSDLKTRRIAAQKALSQEMSAAMMDELVSNLRADNDRNGVPDIMERGRQDGPRTVPSDRIALPDGMTPEELDAAIALAQQSKNTHTARPDSDKPNGRPAKRGGANF